MRLAKPVPNFALLALTPSAAFDAGVFHDATPFGTATTTSGIIAAPDCFQGEIACRDRQQGR